LTLVNATSYTNAPIVALLSNDDDLANIVASATETPWRLERHSYAGGLVDFLRLVGVRLVILDDELVGESDRSWLLAQLRRNLGDATLLYVASSHSLENERRARGQGAHYYTSKPIQGDQLAVVLRGFMNRVHK
jgi:DNA-binding response OmpR family regulator